MVKRFLLPAGIVLGSLVAVPAVASGPVLELSVPVVGCDSSSWLQVTTPDGEGVYELDGDTLTITSGVIGDGVDHRFTVQTNLPVDGCHVTDPGVLTLDGNIVDPYQRALAPGGANLQVTWRSEAPDPELSEPPAEPEEPEVPEEPSEPEIPEVPETPDIPVAPADKPAPERFGKTEQSPTAHVVVVEETTGIGEPASAVVAVPKVTG